ncbi:hypothetical protein [Plastoroseomonas hellenica]|nr:hypothetical protein [Plastoroseomonas hellenica]
MSDVFEIESTFEAHGVKGVTQFVRQIEGAAAFLTAAHAGDGVRVLAPGTSNRRSRDDGLYTLVVKASGTRLRRILTIFSEHPVQGPGMAAEFEAFRMLSELTPAGPKLLALASWDRRRAYEELARHMDLVRQQFEAAAVLADAPLAVSAGSRRADVEDGARFATVRDALLVRAGGTLSLTEAAGRMGVSRQALHKRIASGGALGMMSGSEIVVPRAQFAESAGRLSILPGINKVVKLFKEAQAGAWAALQFLLDPDPNLNRAPIEALKAGEVTETVLAARAHLGMDEE